MIVRISSGSTPNNAASRDTLSEGRFRFTLTIALKRPWLKPIRSANQFCFNPRSRIRSLMLIFPSSHSFYARQEFFMWASCI